MYPNLGPMLAPVFVDSNFYLWQLEIEGPLSLVDLIWTAVVGADMTVQQIWSVVEMTAVGLLQSDQVADIERRRLALI